MEPVRKIGTAPPQATPLDPSDILTPEELAERLKVKVTWVYEKCRPGGSYNRTPLPVLRCGHYLRFDWNAVCAWLRAGNNS